MPIDKLRRVWLLFRWLSVRYWKRHRGAFFLSSVGVALGIAVFVAIQVANHSVLASFQNSLDAVSGKATLQIQGGSNGLPDATFAQIKNLGDARIKAAAPIVSRTFFSPTLKTSLLFLGVDIFSEADFRSYDFENDDQRSSTRAGTHANTRDLREALRFLIDPQAVALSESTARRHKLHAGSTFVVYIGARPHRFHVVSLLRGAQFEDAFGGDFVLLDIAAAQEAFDQIDSISRIDLAVEERDIPAVTRVLRPLLPPDALVQRPAQRGQEVSAMLAAFRLNLSALSCIAIFVGAFLIYNAIASAVVRRRAEVGIVRAVGGSQNQLRALFLIEAGCIGLFGSLLGLALGLLLARFALQAVSTTVSALYVAVKARQLFVPAWLWWGAPTGGVLLSVLAAVLPASEAATTSPRAATLDTTLHQTTTRFAWPLAASGGVLLLCAALLCSPAISARSPLYGFVAAFSTLSGFALLTPLITLYLATLVQPIVGAVFGVEGVLACTQLRRALNRSSLVIAALMVALSMSVGLAVMVRSFRASVDDWVRTSIRGDLYVATATGFSGDSGPGLPREVIDFVRQSPDVKLFDSIRGADTTLRSRTTGRPLPVYIAANELPALASGDRSIRFLETANGAAAARRAHLNGTGILVSERFKNLLGYSAGDTVTLQTPRGPVRFFIAGVFYDYTPDQAVIYLPRVLYRKYWRDDGIDALALHLKAGRSVADLKRRIENRFGAKYQLTLLPNAAIRENVFTTFDNTFQVTYALQLIAVFVAAVGIFNTLWSLLLERRREMAAWRALGASSGQITKATLIEFGLIGVFGWLLAIGAGLCLAWQLIFVINRQFFGWTIGWTLQPAVLFQALALALIASLGAGVLPSFRVARENIAAGLQRE